MGRESGERLWAIGLQLLAVTIGLQLLAVTMVKDRGLLQDRPQDCNKKDHGVNSASGIWEPKTARKKEALRPRQTGRAADASQWTASKRIW